MPEEENDVIFGADLPEPPTQSDPNTAMLSFVIEAAVSHSYREFQVLSQLLQNKSISDRQVALESFADSMMNMSVKLLDLVKWLEKGKQVERYKRVCYYLDQKSDIYADTANSLACMRNQLIFAKMPFLQVAPAVDVLCSGAFVRLPTAIKERFLGPPEMTELQEKLTLKWLSNLIRYRLIQESSLIPKQISEIQVENGMATFTVPKKFSFVMTLNPAEGKISRFGDDPVLVKWRWRLLKIDVLMPEPVVGFGSSLLAPEHKDKLLHYCSSQLQHDAVDIYFVHGALNSLVMKIRERLWRYREQRRSLTNSHCFFIE